MASERRGRRIGDWREAGLERLSGALRREFLARAAALGVVGGTAGALLAACSAQEEEPPLAAQRAQDTSLPPSVESAATGPGSGE